MALGLNKCGKTVPLMRLLLFVVVPRILFSPPLVHNCTIMLLRVVATVLETPGGA